MKTIATHVGGLLCGAACLVSVSARGEIIANSIAEFSDTQGQNGWFFGYRDLTVDGKGAESYDANADFLPFDASLWNGTGWDLDAGAGNAPWTMLDNEGVHPNGSNSGNLQWAIRRYVPSELSASALIGVTWNVRKQNVGGGNGVTGALYVNGVRVQSKTIAFNDAVGVTNTYNYKANPTDKIDLALSPVGTDGADTDASDGSLTWMKVETLVDSDTDGLPDVWEEKYFPGDLTKLSGTGDFDKDGLTDAQEMARGSDPTKEDSDGDGLKDGAETNTGTWVSATNTGTDPMKADTDGDGLKDGVETNTGTWVSTTNTGTNPLDPDSDDDTYLDGDEAATGHDPHSAADNPDATAIGNSEKEFSGVQGQDGWYFGYRNYTKDGGGDNYDAANGFLPFEESSWTGAYWNLDPSGAAPWTEMYGLDQHPNGSNNGDVHWVVRRWSASELTQETPLALRWFVRHSNSGCGGNGITGGLYINGILKDKVTIAGPDGVGVTHTFFANVKPTDRIDVTLSPRGTDGADADGCDGSQTRLIIDPVLPEIAVQPDGTVFIPVGSGDSDHDGIPDAWEKIYFPGDLTKLTAAGDYDKDGLKDVDESTRDTDPTKPDTDGDGLGDVVETNTGKYLSATDTGSNPKKTDTDGDGLSDSTEVGRTPPTDPNKVDTDGDTFSDPDEIAGGTDPNNPADNPLTYVIANSRKEFSGTQGKDGWYNGYRAFDPVAGVVDYDPNADFIPYPGGEGQGDWDGVGQTWSSGSWDLNTAGAAPWTWQDAIGVHPNGTNSAPVIGGEPSVNNEHWAIRRWKAAELTKDTPVTVIWSVRKANTSSDGTTGFLFINGKLVDSKALAGTDTTGEVRRYRTTLKSTDVVDLALAPVGLSGAREDWSDASETWFWVDTKAQATAPATMRTATVDAVQGKVTVTWSSVAGAKYSVQASLDLKTWSTIATGLPSGGETTSYTETLGSPRPAYRFYRVISE